ncbi:hypothetical protein [Acrocarpospora corrugata]|nr:hypothetical protein [Acrocarpospora corrugata]
MRDAYMRSDPWFQAWQNGQADEGQVDSEFVSGWLRITTPSEIALYAQAFRLLASQGVYGEAARALMRASLESLES